MNRQKCADLLRHIVGNPFAEPLLHKVACCPKCMGMGSWWAQDYDHQERHYYPCGYCEGGLRPTRAKLSAAAKDLAQLIYDGDQSASPLLHDALLDCGLEALAEHFADSVLCAQCGGTMEYDDVAHEDADGMGGIVVTVCCERCVNGRVPMVQEYNDGGTSYWFNLLEPNTRHLTPERAQPKHPKGCWALDLILGKE